MESEGRAVSMVARSFFFTVATLSLCRDIYNLTLHWLQVEALSSQPKLAIGWDSKFDYRSRETHIKKVQVDQRESAKTAMRLTGGQMKRLSSRVMQNTWIKTPMGLRESSRLKKICKHAPTN